MTSDGRKRRASIDNEHTHVPSVTEFIAEKKTFKRAIAMAQSEDAEKF